MSQISIKRPHHTTTAEAKKVAERVAAKLEKEYQLKSSWQGDVLSFTRSGVNGTLAVTTKELHIDVKLGFLMVAFKAPIQGAIEGNLDKMLTAPKATEAAKKPAAKAKK